MLEKFKWGPNLFKVNRECFDLYENCRTSDELKVAEAGYLALPRAIDNSHDLDDLDDLCTSSDEEQ
jgi:hypothetical protein